MSTSTLRTDAYLTDDHRWRAVLRREPAADGVFYYSVRTTGVFCRPVCPARRPVRHNVRFHASCAEARSAGFRPCKRCRPEEVRLDPHSAAIARACRMMDQSQTVPDCRALARAVGMSVSQFHRTFKSRTGVTPRGYAAARRGERIRQELAREESVTAAMHNAGFQSTGRFYETAGKVLGMQPRSFRAGGAGERIRFAVGQCGLGAILVAASERGLCWISLGDDAEVLLREFQERFRKAELIGGDAQFEQTVARVVGFVDEPARGLDLPLDIRGTAFQQRVWEALRRIPPGSRVTYTELAERIGRPAAVRAVAGACAANVLAVAIPCHRVVRTDGTLSGYRWGIERKRELLEREGDAAPSA